VGGEADLNPSKNRSGPQRRLEVVHSNLIPIGPLAVPPAMIAVCAKRKAGI
jgi:hypothetical protein